MLVRLANKRDAAYQKSGSYPKLRDRCSDNVEGVNLSDFELHSECNTSLTKEQVSAIRNMAYYRFLLMIRDLRGEVTPHLEAAFFNGVMSAFFACRSRLNIPAPWLLGRASMLKLLARWKAEGKLQGGG